MLVQQRADHSGSVHAANLRNFRRRHRLLVRNHRQRLERRHGQTQRRPQALDEPAYHIVLLRLRVHLVPARHRANLDPALFDRITRHQFIQRRLHRQLFFAQRLGQLLDRRRLVGRVNNRFQRRFPFFVIHSDSLIPIPYLYSSSTIRNAPCSSNATSKLLPFFTTISPNIFSCTSSTACSFTISSTARNATIIACREGQASKN